MPEFKKYEIENPDTGEKIVISYGHQPNRDEAEQIFRLKSQEKLSLAQADQASNLFTKPALQKAALETGKGLGKAALTVGGTAALTTLSPITGTAAGLGMIGYGGYQGLKGAYNAYNNPARTTADTIEAGGNLAKS